MKVTRRHGLRNVTGLSYLSEEIIAKRLELLKELVSGLARSACPRIPWSLVIPSFGNRPRRRPRGLRSCKSMVISSLPSRLKATLQTAGPHRSTDVTPPPRYAGPGQVLTFRTRAQSSFVPPTRRMPLRQYQDIPRADPGRCANPRF